MPDRVFLFVLDGWGRSGKFEAMEESFVDFLASLASPRF